MLVVAITIILSLITAIVSFASSSGIIGVGVVSLIVCLIICICAYKWGQRNIKLAPMKSLSIVLAILIFILFIVSVSKSCAAARPYAITFDKQGGRGGSYSVEAYYDKDMPYASEPYRTGYEFLGYYSETNGYGTKYYDENMNSVRKWDRKYSTTLYAYWEKEGIKLSSSNFEDYFALTSSCSVSGTYSRTAYYSYSIEPKYSFKYNQNSANPSSISVTIGLDISSSSTLYGTPSEYKIYVTLYKSNGYKASGSRSYSIGTYENYWSDGIYDASGKIFN